jgi:hypothetical protein
MSGGMRLAFATFAVLAGLAAAPAGAGVVAPAPSEGEYPGCVVPLAPPYPIPPQNLPPWALRWCSGDP